MRWPKLTLTNKIIAATVAAVALAEVFTIIPAARARRDTQEREIYRALANVAKLDATLKAQALATGDVSAVKKNMPFWPSEPYPIDQALVDTSGNTRAAEGAPPAFSEGEGNAFLSGALKGQTVKFDRVGGAFVAVFPLGPSGRVVPGEKPLGGYVASAQSDKAIAAVRRAYGGGWLGAFLSILAAVGLIGAVNYALLLRPVRSMADRAAGIDVEIGRFPPPAASKQRRTDELARVARVQDMLIARVQESQALAQQANALLERAEAKCRSYESFSAEILWRMDLEGKFLFASAALERLLGIAPQEIYDSAEAFYERVHPEDRDKVRAAVRSMLEGRAVGGLEFRALPRTGSGKTLWLALFHRPIADRGKKTRGFEGELRDITRLKRLEFEVEDCRLRHEALRELAQRRRSNLTRRALFDVFACQSAEVLGMDRAIVTRIAGDNYRVLGLFDFPEEVAREGHPLSGAPQGEIVRTGAPVILLEEQAWTAYGLETPYVGVPIVDLAGAVIGTICSYGQAGNATEENIGAVAVFGELLVPFLAPLTSEAKEHGKAEGRGGGNR